MSTLIEPFETFSPPEFNAGTRTAGLLTVSGTAMTIPFVIQCGKRRGAVLLITAGIHSTEYTSMEAALRLCRPVEGHSSGMLIVLPIVNHTGFRSRSYALNPDDWKNINRVFPGSTDGTPSERIANLITVRLLRHVNAYLDLHCGDMTEVQTPFILLRKNDPRSFALARSFGAPYFVGIEEAGYSCVAGAALGVPSITPEGGNPVNNAAGVEFLLGGTRRVMAKLGMIDCRESAGDVPGGEELELLTQRAECTGIWQREVEPGSRVEAGTRIGCFRSLSGECLGSHDAQRAGVVLFMLNTLAVNAGDAVCGLGVRSS